jgi:hypothetical protein
LLKMEMGDVEDFVGWVENLEITDGEFLFCCISDQGLIIVVHIAFRSGNIYLELGGSRV